MVEDANDPVNKFKHAIQVIRWTDLGDGSSPAGSREWDAIHNNTEYDSFKELGGRAISGIFESQISGSTPGQRILSMNPKKVFKGEEGNGWY